MLLGEPSRFAAAITCFVNVSEALTRVKPSGTLRNCHDTPSRAAIVLKKRTLVERTEEISRASPTIFAAATLSSSFPSPSSVQVPQLIP
jgi:hypothetical protein